MVFNRFKTPILKNVSNERVGKNTRCYPRKSEKRVLNSKFCTIFREKNFLCEVFDNEGKFFKAYSLYFSITLIFCNETFTFKLGQEIVYDVFHCPRRQITVTTNVLVLSV